MQDRLAFAPGCLLLLLEQHVNPRLLCWNDRGKETGLQVGVPGSLKNDKADEPTKL